MIPHAGHYHINGHYIGETLQMPQDQQSYEGKIVALQRMEASTIGGYNPFRKEKIQRQIIDMRHSIEVPAHLIDWICAVTQVTDHDAADGTRFGIVFCETPHKPIQSANIEEYKAAIAAIVKYRLEFLISVQTAS